VRPEKLADEIKRGDIYKFDEFQKLFDNYITNCFNKDISHGKNLRGRSRDQAWAEEFVEKREVSAEALRLFCMRSSNTVSIGRNGIHDSQLGITYWNERLAPLKGQKVYIRRDIANYVTAWVFDANNDEFICTARAAVFDSPALANTEVEKSVFTKALAAKKREQRIIKQYAQISNKTDSIDSVLALTAGISALTGPTPEADPKIHSIPNTKMDGVIRAKKKQDEEGHQDLTDFLPDIAKSKEDEIYLFDCERPPEKQKVG
jgi:hypothetical protein